MLFKNYTLTLILVLGNFIAGGVASGTRDLQFRSTFHKESTDTRQEVRKLLSPVKTVKRNTVFKNSTSLDTSWNDATLFSIEIEQRKGNSSLSTGVEIVCTTCYVKGTATAQLTVDGNFNISQALRSFKSEVKDDVGNLTNATIHDFETYFEKIGTDITSFDFHLDDLEFPSLNDTNFDLTIPDIPECQLLFQLDGLELYMEIDTTLSAGATYTLSLYKSETPIGVSANQDLEVGIIFNVDLIISAEAEIDISSGFHIHLNDGVAINIPMFSQNISSITMNGGRFEFLPVTIQSAGFVLTALLRLSLQAGLAVGAPPVAIDGISVGTFSSGAEMGIWLNLAEFTTNVTAPPQGDSSGCDLIVEEVYSMAIGAQAGATLAILDHTWGPTPNTSTAFFYTTLASICATTSATTTAAPVTARAAKATGLTTTTLSTKITYTGTACRSTGLLNCPLSLQTTSKNTATKTLITSVPSGSTATFPATTQKSVASTIAFGTNVRALVSTSGSPTSYVPSSTSTSGIVGVIDGKTKGVSNKVIIGVAVGVGVPVLIAIIAGCIFFFRRKGKTSRQESHVVYVDQQGPATPYTPGSQWSIKKSPKVNVSEFR